MRLNPTIILAAFAILLGGLALVHTGGKYRAAIFGTSPTSPGEKLFDIKELDTVRQITLTNSQGDSASFTVGGKFSNYWKAITPWQDRADPVFMRYLMQFTSGLEVREAIPRTGLNLKEFGLREGHVRVTMRDKQGTAICDYRIGRTTAWKIPSDDGKSTSPTIYIRMADKELKGTIYICSENTASNIHSLFANQFARFRDHHPFHFSPQYLDKIRIQNDEGEVIISRPDLRSGWQITKPLELRVDPKALNNLFTDLAKLTAIKVDDRANVTLPTAEDDTTQAREISMHFAGQKDDVTLRIYPPAKPEDQVALATISNRPDAVFHLPLTPAAVGPNLPSLSQLQTGVNDLRSKTMTHLNGPQLKTIIIRPSGRSPIMLDRTKRTTWRVLRRNGRETANQNAVINLMLAVTRDKVTRFVTDAATDFKPYGLDHPMIQLGFIPFQGKGMAIAFGLGPKHPKTSQQKIYAHRLDQPNNIWEIGPATLGKIAVNPWEWRTAHVWHIPKVDIEKIEIEKRGQPAIGLTYQSFSEKWQASRSGTDATAELNPNRANVFLNSIESLTTRRWIGPMHRQAMTALQTPDTVIRVRIRREDNKGNDLPPIIKTLSIAHTQGSFIHFAKVDTHPQTPESEGEENYFLLDPETVTKLKVDLFK